MARTWSPSPIGDVSDSLILFNGLCILCSRWVRFVAPRDAGRFRFTAIRSPYGRTLSIRLGIDPQAPETNAVVLDGVAYFKSDAALAVLGTLPGWSFAHAAGLMPRWLRDGLYDRIARNWYRLFGRTDARIVPAPGLSHRVISDAPG